MLNYISSFIILVSVFFKSVVYSKSNTILVLNALGTNTTDRYASINRIVETFDDLSADFSPYFSSRFLFTYKSAYEILPIVTKNHIENVLKFEVKFYNTVPLRDRGIGRPIKITEQVTPIIESLLEASKSSSDILALSFTNRSIPFPTNRLGLKYVAFMETFSVKVLLLKKNKRLSSVSDWHDLQILALSASDPTVLQWLETLNKTYYAHANRPAYTMLEPRPAILEANFQFRDRLNIDYFPDNKVCAIAWNNDEHVSHHQHDYENSSDIRYIHDHNLEKFHDRRCNNGEPFFEVFCGSGNHHEDHICAITGDPIQWKTTAGLPIESLAEKLKLPERNWKTNFPDAMEQGSLRFRYSKEPFKPGPFCWDKKEDDKEDPRKIFIYDNFDKKRPYVEKKIERKIKVTIITGDHGSWSSIDQYMYQSIGKMYYAKQHGYNFSFQFSNQLVPYFHHDLYSAVGRSDPYMKGVMSKTLMTLDAMYRFPHSEWIFFLDSDAWINADWLDLPLDAFLEDVPADKLWVHTNYHSMLTGAFFVRNNDKGRALVRDWVAVAMSGQVSCHGFDQAAISVLFMLRQAETISERPFGLSCLSKEIVSSESGLPGTGCSGGDWSCDYKFERVLMNMGFKTRSNYFFNDSFSSYSRGCANDQVRDFHVTYETEFRPRLQCFHCGKTYEIESLEWDGPLGGGNERVRMGAVNSYFTNHKANWLFYEQYLKPGACKKRQFIEYCDNEIVSSNDEAESHHDMLSKETFYSKQKHGRRLISLVDGLAIDLENGVFCKLNENSISNTNQKLNTYMKHYPKAVSVAASYNSSYWDQQYRTQGSSQSRSFCKKNTPIEECPDGLNWRKKDGNWFLFKPTLCSDCKLVRNQLLDPTGNRKAVDCSNYN